MSTRAAADPARLMVECLDALNNPRRPLLVGETGAALATALRKSGSEPCTWLREATASSQIEPSAWPEGEGFDAALIRLPKAKDALLLALHAAASKTLAGSRIAVFGANAEGIRSVGRQLEPFVDDLATLGARYHARVLAGLRKPVIAGLKGRLADWRTCKEIDIGGTKQVWVSYPGTFAKGGLDQGTAFLVAHLPGLAHGARVLDFAAGTGVVAAALAASGQKLQIDMIEPDQIALAAARENVPGASAFSGTDLSAAGERLYDLIISNPPIHDGLAESRHVVERLIAEAHRYLRPGGRLMLVVQRRVAVLPLLSRTLSNARIVADDGRFTVAMAERDVHGR